MSLGKNIKFFRKKAGMTQIKLAERSNISRSYLADIENERYNASLDVLKRISKALNVETSLLIEGDIDSSKISNEYEEVRNEILKTLQLFTNDEGHFLGHLREPIFKIISNHLYMAPAYHNSSDHTMYQQEIEQFFKSPEDYSSGKSKELVEEYQAAYNYRTLKSVFDENSNNLEVLIDFKNAIIKLAKQNNILPEVKKFTDVPILGSIAAGQPIDRIELIEGYVQVEDSIMRGRSLFGLFVKGDSMIGDGIYDGDTVVVAHQNEVSPSDIAVVAVNGYEATLKRVRCEGEVCMLIPSNSLMQPTLVPAKDVHILGKVVQSRRNFE
ncbi:MAG: helix-turn-helix domain-containing protein [Bacillota bacterium]